MSLLKKKFLIVILFIFVFFLGFFSNNLIKSNNLGEGNSKNILSFFRFSEKKLTNPLLDCEMFENSSSNLASTSEIKYEINNLIDIYENSLNEISVYYRDLNNGPWFGTNEKAVFSPVSLLKVPLMIAYLKQASTDPEILNQKIVYRGQHLLEENLPPKDRLVTDQTYSFDALIQRMISLSDNIAFELLSANIRPEDLKAVHKDLGLIYPNNSTPEDYIDVKSYAGLFRVLYNATYLSPEMSEKALEYLTKSEFNEGIRAGLPKNIISANKYGIKEIEGSNNLIQLHDCGIIYLPKKPYLLCIMTKGNDRNKLAEVIKEISKKIYEVVVKN